MLGFNQEQLLKGSKNEAVLCNAVKRNAKNANNHFINTSEVTENVVKIVDFSSESHSGLTQIERALENDVRYLRVWKPLELLKFSHV